jgi:hypothetical protein
MTQHKRRWSKFSNTAYLRQIMFASRDASLRHAMRHCVTRSFLMMIVRKADGFMAAQ